MDMACIDERRVISAVIRTSTTEEMRNVRVRRAKQVLFKRWVISNYIYRALPRIS